MLGATSREDHLVSFYILIITCQGNISNVSVISSHLMSFQKIMEVVILLPQFKAFLVNLVNMMILVNLVILADLVILLILLDLVILVIFMNQLILQNLMIWVNLFILLIVANLMIVLN